MNDRPQTIERPTEENTVLRLRIRELEALLAEREFAIQAFRKSEEKYRFLLENTTDYVARYSLDGVLLFASDAIRNINGYRPEEIVGTSAFDRVHPDDALQAREALREAVESGRERNFEYRVVSQFQIKGT